MATLCLTAVHCAPAESDDDASESSESPLASATLLVSTSPARSAPIALNGASGLSGKLYIFTSDASKTPRPAGIKQVRYWLDNPKMTGLTTDFNGVKYSSPPPVGAFMFH